MNIREGLIRSVLSSHLEQNNERPVDVDRVGALGMGAGRLAQLIVHWQASTSDEEKALWLRRTWRLLIRRTAKDLRIRNKGDAGRRSYAILERACFQVITEWAHPECLTCAGVGKVGVKRYEVNSEIRLDELVCQACNGVGKRRYSDVERVKALGIVEDELERWNAHMGKILKELTKAVSSGMARAMDKLSTIHCVSDLQPH